MDFDVIDILVGCVSKFKENKSHGYIFTATNYVPVVTCIRG